MSALVLDRLVRASIEGGLLVLVVALICRLMPSLHARHRAALWWLAAAKLLVALAPVRPLDLPLLPATVTAIEAPAPAAEARVATIAPMVVERPWRPFASPERWLVSLWAAGLLALSAASLAGAFRARRLRRSGRPLDDAALTAKAAEAPAHELSFMCDDLTATMADLRAKGIEFEGEPQMGGFGAFVTMVLPGTVKVLLYQPRHPTAI